MEQGHLLNDPVPGLYKRIVSYIHFPPHTIRIIAMNSKNNFVKNERI